ncbi:MAG: TaqI-like C-terminal specificity domain-containing protein [Actinomycetota bacterium]|nr:TaqI-like C-terminal specificity domain-containing protein [Actinomycetota bacterium]
MDRDSAKRLIQSTLESSFNKKRFVSLVKNILNKYDEAHLIYRGNLIFDDFTGSISSLERIGKYKGPDDKLLDILIIRLGKETSLERARTRQRNYAAKYLKSRGGVLKDGALVAFVAPDGKDWRLSLIKMEYKFNEERKVQEEFTPARRYSFLVGVHENSHTAQSRLLPLLLNDETQPTLVDLENTWGIERVTKEFFEKYRDLFYLLDESLAAILAASPVIAKDFEGKAIDGADFAKKLLGQIVFLYFLQKKGWFGVKKDEPWGSGSKSFLRELFEGKHGSYDNFFNDILEPLFYEALRLERTDDYYSRFDSRIPFLNGGLFDPIGGYDWVNDDILLPSEIFSNDKRTKEGDIGTGILDIFDRYNFTVKEDEPLEKEVAVDPEMLGKVFENLLEVKDRKSKGTYYTPREIVHYMCEESLVNYLAGELEGEVSKEEIETLIKYGETAVEHDSRVASAGRETKAYAFKLPETIRNNAELIDEKLASARICDPAVGSGAFIVGMMNEIVRARGALNAYIALGGGRAPYHFKRHAIENSLYGVDIDQGAVEIAKLRLWLSLVVDEETRGTVAPLPNLDYKITRGNSLLGVEKNLFNHALFTELERLKPLYFNETGAGKKQEYTKEIDELISQITDGHKDFDFEVYFSEVFHEKGGFDVAIGNPPYVQLQKLKGNPLQQAYKNGRYQVYDSNGDIYCLFYEKGMNILNAGGHLCYITSNKWMRAAYGEKLRRYFLEANPKILIDLGPAVFESATVDTNILIIQKVPNERGLLGVTLGRAENISEFIRANGVLLTNLDKGAWFIGSVAQQRLKEKIERLGRPLKDWDVNINYGIKTGLNEAFIIDTATKERLCKEDPKSAEILKPILRGRDIKRYGYDWAGLWIIATFPVLKLDIDDYPAIKKYLLDFGKDRLKQEGNKLPDGSTSRKKTGNKWFETQDQIAYYPEFEKEKVVWIELVDDGRFSYVEPNIFVEATTFLMTFTNPKYLVGILNSKAINWFFDTICASSGVSTNRWKKIYVELLPIPPITPFNKDLVEQIEALVNQILAAKKKDPSADTSHIEKKIDQLVYKLYDLTPEEIAIVEGKNESKK